MVCVGGGRDSLLEWMAFVICFNGWPELNLALTFCIAGCTYMRAILEQLQRDTVYSGMYMRAILEQLQHNTVYSGCT